MMISNCPFHLFKIFPVNLFFIICYYGFIFSSKTGRLSSESYYGNTIFKYNYGVVTLETLTFITDDMNYFKKEYYECKYFDIFINLLNSNVYKLN